MVYGPYPDIEALTQWFNTTIQAVPQILLFAIKDRTRITPGSPAEEKGVFTQETFAGVISYLNTVPEQLQSEIGHIVILKPFQRTHVLTNAVGLLLQHALDSPEQGGMGLRRVQWWAHHLNESSVNAAKKLGFQWEGILRFHRVLPKGRVTNPLPREDGRGGARHTASLSFCWDDWENGGREAIQKKMVLRKK